MPAGTSVYKTATGTYHIFGHAQTKSGFYIAVAPFFKLSKSDTTPEKVIGAIKGCLSQRNTERVPDPKDWDKFEADFVKKAGFSSLSESHIGTTKLIEISLAGNDEMTFIPTKHAKAPDEGFLHKPDEEIRISGDASVREIFDAVNLALYKCE